MALWMPSAAVDLIDVLITYEGEHYWEFIYYGIRNQMVFWWDGRPVYIFEME